MPSLINLKISLYLIYGLQFIEITAPPNVYISNIYVILKQTSVWRISFAVNCCSLLQAETLLDNCSIPEIGIISINLLMDNTYFCYDYPPDAHLYISTQININLY